MKIIVDQQARTIVTQMCDLALKTGGLQNMGTVQLLLQSMEDTTPSSSEVEIQGEKK